MTVTNREGRCPYTDWIKDHHPAEPGVVHVESPILGAWLQEYGGAELVGVLKFRKPRGKLPLPPYLVLHVPNVADAYTLIREGIALMARRGWAL